MNSTELRELQTEFDKKRENLNIKFQEINKQRKKFVKDFSIDKLQKMNIDDFVVGKRDNDSFCNRIENELNDWGNIHGSNALKFGVYFGTLGKDKTKKYRVGKKAFGTDYEKAFENVIRSIVELINSNHSLVILKKNPISPMFKGKILSVYFPNQFLNIFAATHLNYFINCLSLVNNSKSEIDKQNLLLQFKDNDILMKHWSIYEFSKFLYHSFGTPNDEIKEKLVSSILKPYKLEDFPPIENIKPSFIELETVDKGEGKNTKSDKSSKTDFLERSKNNKRIGDRGEQIVLKIEKDFLQKHNRKDLADKVDHIASKNDSAGYDILSFDLNENEINIEVKTTLKSAGKSRIFLSSNEINKGNISLNHFIYVVYEAGSKTPKIWKIKTSDFLTDTNIKKEPILYQFFFETK